MHVIRQRRNINSPATGGKHKAQPGRDESPDQCEMTLVPPAIEPPAADHPLAADRVMRDESGTSSY
jgi:hypothetical protein